MSTGTRVSTHGGGEAGDTFTRHVETVLPAPGAAGERLAGSRPGGPNATVTCRTPAAGPRVGRAEG